MRTILFVLFAFIATFNASAQSKMSCCSMTSTEEFAMLTTDDKFNNSHAEPLPYVFPDDIGQMVGFKTPDGKTSNAFQILTPYKTTKWLFVFHEWWGLNDYMKKEAVKYFEKMKDVNILVIDLYDGKVATTREEAGQLMGNLDDARARSIIQGAIKFVGKQADIATIGWCMGGGWSLQATLMAGKQATGAVMYYGMPEKDVEKLKTLQADVLFVFAAKDDWINRDVLNNFTADMKTASKNLLVKEYDAVHAFANPSNPNYNVTFAEDAFNESIRFLNKRFFTKGG
ncbi:hypothetical protein BH09BAC1_BH09BAC1_01430 [soil metagenome]